MAKMKPYLVSFRVAATLLLLCPQGSLSFSQRRNIDPEIQREIDNFVQNNYLPAAGIPGIGLTIVQNDGEILYATGYGPANIEKGIPIGNSTQFLMASVTKSFTSVVAAKLLHENFPELGEAVMDTPIRKLLPQIDFTLNDRFRSEQANFRDLLGHRLCLLRDDIILWADPFNKTEEIAYRTRYNNEICGIRTQYHYNNQIYVLAGELIGILANKPYKEVVQELLNDLGMFDTTFMERTDDYPNMLHRAQPYFVLNSEVHPLNPELVKRIAVSKPTAGLLTTPNDMVNYLQFRLNMGSLDGRQIVPREIMEWVGKPGITYPDISYKKSERDPVINQFAYGQGLIFSSYDGWEYIQHSGYLPPFLSQMSLFPEKNLGIFSTVSSSPVKVDQLALHAFIFELLQGKNEAEAEEKAILVDNQIKRGKDKEASVMNAELQKYYINLRKQAPMIGTYASGSAGEATVSKKFNKHSHRLEYYVEYGRWYKGWLEPGVDEASFNIHWDTDVIHDDYARGYSTHHQVVFANNSLVFFVPFEDSHQVYDRFKLGLRLDQLPPVPWSQDSCGPEEH